MPQMNPIWWTSLFCMFILILLLTNSLNYFFKSINSIKKLNKVETKNKIVWKW
uniref:ATP synthase complex subunit 8 n=1 Tax=Paracaecilius japanus TaxID=297965 RepID=A0A8K1ZG43_9NEOP|nr:ATP synthase F0 subunit 8 [Paracaecilius japanus]